MKRTLAVLLTFFVLTYSACADELVDVAWHVDSEMLGEFLASCGFNEKIAATVSDAAEHISAHLSGKASVREDGGHFVLSFDETDLIDADWIQMEQNWRIHTSLLPGIQLEMPDINGKVLAATFKQVSDHVQACIQDMEPTEEHGRFWGYTYQSGDRRIRYSFDQKKLAGLLCAVMEKLGVSDDQQIKELLEAESAMAEEGVYSLLLSYVYHGEVLTGISTTLTAHNEPVAALSISSSSEQDMHAVLGVGFPDAVYYADIKLSCEKSSGTVNGYLDLYTDAMGIGFESARSYGLSAGSIVFNGYKSETESESNFSAEIQFEQEGHSVLSQQIVCKVTPEETRITNSAVSPGNNVPFYSSDLSIQKSDTSFEATLNPLDKVISLTELPSEWDTLNGAAQNGMQVLLLKMAMLVPALTQIDRNQ